MQFFKSKTIITVFVAVAIVSAISAVVFLKFEKGDGIVRASAGDNVHGFAWNENYGWISFNSADCDLDSNGKVDSGACEGDNSTILVKDYGTKIDVTTGDTTGYAWNPLVGYICIGSTCAASGPLGTPSVANYDRPSGRLSGWAKVISFGDNGWIQFDNAADLSKGVRIDAGTGIATGWAWGGYDTDSDSQPDTGIGWISFNSNGCDTDGDGLVDNIACGAESMGSTTSIYAVTANVNRPPNVSGVDVDYTGANDPCLEGNTVKNVTLKWDFDDDDLQSGYKIALSPGANGPYVASTTNHYGVMTGLAYNTPYTYTLTVWDSGNPALSTTTTGAFTTKPNEYPDASFTWYAPNASAEEEIMFVGVGQYYTTALPATPTACIDAACSWQWTTTKADTISAPTASSTMITFAEKGEDDVVTLVVTSVTDGLSCSTSTTMKVSEKLPDWQEQGN